MTRILIVEDERIVATELEHTLTKLGYGVSGIAASGGRAIALAWEERPDLVLMDIRIEGERDGIATAETMRARFQIPVIYLTAFADQHTVRRATESEPYGYLVKPFSDSQLRSAIEVALVRYHAESRVKERERWYSTTLRAIGDGVIAADHTGQVTFMNKAAEVLTGLRADEATGQPLAEVFHVIEERTRNDVPTPSAETLGVGAVTHLPANSALVAADGSDVPVDTSVASIVDDAGNMLGAVTVFRDITERRRLQEQLAMADRLASLGILAAGIAHEINNPLTSVAVYADDAASELSAVERDLAAGHAPSDLERRVRETAEGVTQIRIGAERIARIVSDLKMFSRAGHDPRELVDARRTLDWAARVALKELDERIQVVRTFESLPLVRANEAKLAQVFVNLLVNAAQSISPTAPGPKEIRIGGRTDDHGNVVLSVADTGCGIPAENINHIFEPFFTTKQVGVGTGLGLSISHGIVKAFGGEIRVRSTLGKGTTFEVILPPGGEETAAPASGSAARGRRQTGRILVLDEEPLMLQWLTRVLGREHNVSALGSAVQALRLLQTEGVSEFDLVFCDLTMSEMSAIDFYTSVRALSADAAARLVFVTEGALPGRVQEFLASVDNPRLEKPFSSDSVRAFVKRVLDSWDRT